MRAVFFFSPHHHRVHGQGGLSFRHHFRFMERNWRLYQLGCEKRRSPITPRVFSSTLGAYFPLPEGEGQGEGERRVVDSKIARITSSDHTLSLQFISTPDKRRGTLEAIPWKGRSDHGRFEFILWSNCISRSPSSAQIFRPWFPRAIIPIPTAIHSNVRS
jgi:hypothetical protein